MNESAKKSPLVTPKSRTCKGMVSKSLIDINDDDGLNGSRLVRQSLTEIEAKKSLFSFDFVHKRLKQTVKRKKFESGGISDTTSRPIKKPTVSSSSSPQLSCGSGNSNRSPVKLRTVQSDPATESNFPVPPAEIFGDMSADANSTFTSLTKDYFIEEPRTKSSLRNSNGPNVSLLTEYEMNHPEFVETNDEDDFDEIAGFESYPGVKWVAFKLNEEIKTGNLIIAPKTIKPIERPSSLNLIMFVLNGEVIVRPTTTITQNRIFKRKRRLPGKLVAQGGTIHIPPHTYFALENRSSSLVKLGFVFTSAREPTRLNTSITVSR